MEYENRDLEKEVFKKSTSGQAQSSSNFIGQGLCIRFCGDVFLVI